MFKEDTQNELIGYISRMDEGEQEKLLDALKKKELYRQAAALDAKGRKMKKGKKITIDEVCAIVREVRRENARKRA